MLSFIFSFICFQVFDYTSKDFPERLTLFFNPYDIIEVRVRSFTYTLFKYWEDLDGFRFYIDEIIHKNSVVSHIVNQTFGPFDSNSKLAAVFFRNNNYSLKFRNEGKNTLRFQIIITKNLNWIFFDDYELYPALKEKLDIFSSPFIFYADHPGKQYFIAITIIFLIIANAIIFYNNYKY